jgi:hypothetical protein
MADLVIFAEPKADLGLGPSADLCKGWVVYDKMPTSLVKFPLTTFGPLNLLSQQHRSVPEVAETIVLTPGKGFLNLQS